MTFFRKSGLISVLLKNAAAYERALLHAESLAFLPKAKNPKEANEILNAPELGAGGHNTMSMQT